MRDLSFTFPSLPPTHTTESKKGKNINGARKEEDHQAPSKHRHPLHTRRAQRHVHMLHKAYTVLNLPTHLAHLTQTLTKPATETSAHTRGHTRKKKLLRFLLRLSSGSTEINKTVN
jgi:hypothetical protein